MGKLVFPIKRISGRNQEDVRTDIGQKIQLDYLYPKRSFSKLPKFFSKEEVRNILDNTQNLKHKAILMTIYSCGLRLSELLNLKIKDIKSSDGIIRIHQSKGNKDRIVSLPDKLLATLRHYYQAFKPKEYLFEGEKGGKYSERSVQLILKKALIKANVQSEGSVHTGRHSYATHLIQSGIDIRIVKELLGHENIKTTMIYTHITDIDKQKTPSPLDFYKNKMNFSRSIETSIMFQSFFKKGYSSSLT